jgi:riboflavin kinase/FMN adenylyltransferase
MIVLDGPWESWEATGDPAAITIGVLDGVHLGHRALIGMLDPMLTRTVLTFEPHPIEVLRPGTVPRLLTTIDERIELLAASGVDVAGVLDLAKIKDQSPDTFVREVLIDKLAVRQLVVGSDFRFGKDRAGDVRLLESMGSEIGCEVVVIDLVTDESEPVSSSRIRALIEQGDVATAATLMGSRFTLTNHVVPGDERGAELGFPTANLAPPARKVIPATGIYACFARVGGVTHPAAVNVGHRPTFGGGALLIEAHILDFDRSIYGESLTLEFVEFLRGELKFDTVDTLVANIREDVARTRSVLRSVESRI